MLGSNIDTLFSYIDRHCHSLYDEWCAPIMFTQYREDKKIHNDIARFVPKEFKQLNESSSFKQSYFSLDEDLIVNGYNGGEFTALSKNIHNDIAPFVPNDFKKLTESASFKQSYFSHEEYPIVNGYNGEGFKALSRDIQRASVSSDFHIFKNGMPPVRRLKISKVQKFCCAHSRRYVSQQKSTTLSTHYRKSFYHHNRKNSRGPCGQKMSRRTSILKLASIANTCIFACISN